MRDVDSVLAKEFYRLACYARMSSLSRRAVALRIYQSAPLLREDGELVRVLIYFVLRDSEAVELQHIEAIEEEKL